MDSSDRPYVPRRLHYLKCSQCRKDKKKCLPFDRSWPRDKCDRCAGYHYACSASMTASQDNQLQQQQDVVRSMRPPPEPQQPSGVQSVIPDSEKCNGRQPGLQADGKPSWPKCAPYFSTLIKASWSQFMGISRYIMPYADLKPMDTSAHDANRVYDTLTSRLFWVYMGRKHANILQEWISNGTSLEESWDFASRTLLHQIRKEQDQRNPRMRHLKLPEYAIEVDIVITRALRWQTLVDAVGVYEVLLIHCSDNDSLRSIPLPEVESVSDEEWPSLLRRLLSPALGLKETCLKLSGLVDMIQRLKELERSELKTYLADSIEKRVGSVLGNGKSVLEEFDDDDDDSMADTD